MPKSDDWDHKERTHIFIPKSRVYLVFGMGVMFGVGLMLLLGGIV